MSTQPPRPPDWSRPNTGPLPWDAPGEQRGPEPFAGGPDPYGRPTPPKGGGAGRKAAAAAGLVAVAVAGAGGGYWLGHRGDSKAVTVSSPSSGRSPSGTASSPASSSSSSAPVKKVPLSGVAKMDAAAARAQIKQAGLAVQGKGVEAWGWTDTNGRNLFLTTKTVEKTEGSVVRAATLHVYHVAGLDSRPKMMLTPLRDPGVPNCDVDFALDFVPGSIQVTDTDGDGYGEASVGWSYLCAGDPEPQHLKLALVTKGTYYILRGTGQRVTDPAPPSGITFPKASFVPNLPASKWPAGTYQKTVALFHTLFK